MKLAAAVVIWLSAVTLLQAEELQFSLHKLVSSKPGPTLLVIGGIQGDEPGGFTAASMLVTDYTITAGNVWVVPNLNFASIIKRSRGIHGDMNRKFHHIHEDDPEYAAVQKIKQIIIDKQVDVVLNLHDGSGFYKKTYINHLHNPNRWGQSIIIDQDKMPAHEHGDLAGIATRVQQYINKKLKVRDKYFYVKNTHTRKGNREMEKSLTYFSIRNNKPAFAVEASKSFRTGERAYYHLLAVEGFMQYLGIEYQRNFVLTRAGVSKRIGKNLKISLYDNRINLEVDNSRRLLNYIPLKKDASLQYRKNNPLIAVLKHKQGLKIRYGNRYVTSLKPQYFEYDDSLKQLQIQVDGVRQTVNVGDKIYVNKQFRVMAEPDYRVNVIGYARAGVKNENGLLISRKQILPRFSIDRGKSVFRIEIYRGKKFSGMVLVDFSRPENTAQVTSMLNNTVHQVASEL